MKASTRILLGLAPLANAFPAAVMEQAAHASPEVLARMADILDKRQAGAGAATALFEPLNTFSERQLIDVSEGSGHEYQAPGPNDLRGPCPGLNAFANHGFLPHNGYATITQFVDVTTEVVGMGPVLALFLSAYGAAIDGSGTAWSIGGTPPASIGTGNGLSGSHNKYEGDASPTRPDLYEAGNNYETQANQFTDLINHSPGGEVTLESLTSFRSDRFDQQIANNPYFFNGPFSGVLVQPAAYTFIYRFMANHSQENPAGLLDYNTIESWFGMTKDSSGNYVANQGQERIPDNWYRRAFEYPYETTYFTADLNTALLLHPKFANIGGNTGTTNSFTGVDVEDLTGGVLNAQSLLEGNNLACLAYQASAQAKPDLLLGLLDQLTDTLSDITGALTCPQLQAIDQAQLEQFPGYDRSSAARS